MLNCIIVFMIIIYNTYYITKLFRIYFWLIINQNLNYLMLSFYLMLFDEPGVSNVVFQHDLIDLIYSYSINLSLYLLPSYRYASILNYYFLFHPLSLPFCYLHWLCCPGKAVEEGRWVGVVEVEVADYSVYLLCIVLHIAFIILLLT